MRIVTALALILVVLGAAVTRPSEPKLFAEGIVSTPGDESGFALSPDGQTAFFGKRSPTTSGDSLQVICLTHLNAQGRWAEPEIASFSGRDHDLGPAFTPDGSRLYFVSDRPNGNPAQHDFNIWYVARTASGWSDPQALGAPVNSPSQEYGVSVAANGTLYFASNRPGGAGSFDLYRSRLEGGQYQTVESVGEPVNTKGPELQPAISPDENILVFTAIGRDDERIGVHKDYARGDLYVSFRRNGAWTPARNCGPPINSGGGESWPAFAAGGARFFFSSERGFATGRLSHRMTWSQLRRALDSTLNGMGNIYEASTLSLTR